MENKKIENCQETGRSSRVLVWVSKEASDLLTWAHLINRFVLIALIAIHILAVFFYFFFKHENLIGPMITGMKRWPAASETTSGNNLLAAAIIGLAILAVYLLVHAH